MISVIVATYNRSSALKKTLDALLRQEKDGTFDFEVIVIDNNSNDETRQVTEAMSKDSNGRLRYILEPRQGKPFALNKGIQEARGEILVFTDDDVTLMPDWLLQIKECFNATHCDGLGGRVLPDFPSETPAWVRSNPVKIAGGVVIYDYGEETVSHDPTRYPFIGANFAFRKKIFDDCGQFRTDLIFDGRIALGEDTEFVERVMAKNKKLVYFNCDSGLACMGDFCLDFKYWRRIAPDRY